MTTFDPEQATTTAEARQVRGYVEDTRYEPQVTGWTGWITFASVMMLILGVFHAIAGLTAIFKEDYYQVANSDLVVEASYDAWGWVHLVFGVLIVLAGLSLLSGRMYGRIAAVVLASLSAIYNIAFLAAYPIWSIAMVAINILVIWAVVVHGREMAMR